MNKFLGWLSVVVSICNALYLFAMVWGFRPGVVGVAFMYLTLAFMFASNAIDCFRRDKEVN